tara:strand:- start:1925 stop:4801 length:2877 start_codon:yes stop_codon:yes gene_type:complete
MPLITSTTALNKIKWGNDRYDGGNSGQPYIKRDIPGVNVNTGDPTIVNDDSNPPAVGGMDFLWRGGLSAPIDAARDVSRLTQMMFDLKSPNGFEFIAKQNLLSRTAVKTEASFGIGYGGVTPPNFINGNGGGAVNAGIYLPTSTLAQAAVGFTGTHLNLLGLDPSSPMNGNSGGGLFPGAGLNPYFDTIKANNNPATYDTKFEDYQEKVLNPLWLTQIQQIPLDQGITEATEPEFNLVTRQRLVESDQTNFKNRLVNLNNLHSTSNSPIILSYTGGPGSILGIGSTDIMFADQRTGFNNPLYVSDESYFLGGAGSNRNRYNRNPESKQFRPKLGASIIASGVFPNDKESLTKGTDDNILQDLNSNQSTIRNAQLSSDGFFNPTGSNNYSIFRNTSDGVTSGSIDYLLPSKLGASTKAEEALPSISESLSAATTENALQNVNLQNNTINNPELRTGMYQGFIDPDTGENNYSVFKNSSNGVTSGSINYEKVKLPLLSSLSSSDSTNLSSTGEYEEAQDLSAIQNQNIPQSTFRNAKIDGDNSFFNPTGPNNFGIFGVKNVELSKQNIFISGSSVSYAFASLFPSTENSIFEGLALDSPGGLKLFNNNVYDSGSLTTSGREGGGAAWAQGTMTLTQAQIESQVGYLGKVPILKDFRKEIINSQLIDTSPTTGVSSVLSLAPNYSQKSRIRRVNSGDPGKSNTKFGSKNVFNYGLPATQMQALDKLTAMPMYDGTGPNTSLAINDFVKFRIAAINNDSSDGSAVYMHFRAFIDSFSDSYTADWSPTKYSGRGENLYNYSGFGRTISLSFTCFAQSKPELIPMFKKLNYLASTLAPDYTAAGFMRGNIVRLTLGGYLYEQPGFISALTYDIPQEAPWEISINAEGGGDGSVKELPHMIKVTGFSFTPIHNFLPQKPNDANSPNERFIALSNNGGKGNYNDSYPLLFADGDGDNNNSNDILGE